MSVRVSTIWMSLIAVLGLVLIACGWSAWFAKNWRSLLLVESPVQNVDAIIVLGGEAQARPELAAKLYHQGVAPLIFVVGTGDNETGRRVLLRAGVPADRLVCETASESTLENALFTSPLLKQSGVRNALLITSPFHTRRALATFQQRIPEIRFHVASARIGWWDTPQGSPQESAFASIEMIKIPVYWLIYGIHPWVEKSPLITQSPVYR